MPESRYITILDPQEGGATVEIFTQLNGESRPLASAAVTVGDPNAVSVIDIAKPDADEFGPEDPLAENNTDDEFYDPASGETVVAHLTKIVATNLAYNPEDLTSELPLMELGLDSLMAIRIKNRIRSEFQIPELDLMVVRSSTIGDVAEYISNVRDAQSPGLSDEEASEVSAQKLAEKKADENAAAGNAGNGAGADVPPRDASERLAFSTWVTVTGESAGDVMRPLPQIGDETRAKLAERLAERTGSDIDPVLLQDVTNIEQLANIIRPFLEKEVDGLVRTLRDFPEGQHSKALFLFHRPVAPPPSILRWWMTCPLTFRCLAWSGWKARWRSVLPSMCRPSRRCSQEGPYTLGGWSLGGALAYEVAKQLIAAGDEVSAILLIDTVQPSEPDPGTREELHARWTHCFLHSEDLRVNFQVPHDILDAQGENGMMKLFAQMAATADLSNTGVSAAVLEHQRASFVDNRMLANLDMDTWASVQVPVTLYRAERMHDGAIELEPRYANIDPDGGWGKIVKDLTVVRLKGDHLSVIDEPEVGKIARNITERRESLGL
ncbi:MAG: thioesterase domain-containing protein [Lawsonella clevelandensis]